MDLTQYSAVLFDFDGILVDSETFFYKAYQKVFEDELKLEVNRDDYFYYWSMLGEGLPGEIKRRNISLTDQQFQEIEQKRNQYYRNFCENGDIRFIPGMIEVARQLGNKGIKAIIASNTAPDVIETIFQVSRISPPCAIIGKHPGLRGKPHPDIFVYAAGYLNVNPVNCLVIEDALKGIQAAKKVSMDTAFICSSYSNRAKELINPDFIFNNHSEFIAKVSGNSGR